MAKTEQRPLKQRFLDWQCQLRQEAMRVQGGRPSPGMQPRVLDEDGRTLLSALTVVIVPKKPKEATAFFRFQVQRSADPRETYEKALRFLQSDYYSRPKTFSKRLLAVLPMEAPLADILAKSGRCVLAFAQGRHGFRLPCKVKRLKGGDEKREAAIWHNRIFNPALPDKVQVLAFKPDWDAAETTF